MGMLPGGWGDCLLFQANEEGVRTKILCCGQCHRQRRNGDLGCGLQNSTLASDLKNSERVKL